MIYCPNLKIESSYRQPTAGVYIHRQRSIIFGLEKIDSVQYLSFVKIYMTYTSEEVKQLFLNIFSW